MNISDAYIITFIIVISMAITFKDSKKYYSYKSNLDSSYEGRFDSLEECIKNETFAKAIQQKSDYNVDIGIRNTTCEWR